MNAGNFDEYRSGYERAFRANLPAVERAIVERIEREVRLNLERHGRLTNTPEVHEMISSEVQRLLQEIMVEHNERLARQEMLRTNVQIQVTPEQARTLLENEHAAIDSQAFETLRSGEPVATTSAEGFQPGRDSLTLANLRETMRAMEDAPQVVPTRRVDESINEYAERVNHDIQHCSSCGSIMEMTQNGNWFCRTCAQSRQRLNREASQNIPVCYECGVDVETQFNQVTGQTTYWCPSCRTNVIPVHLCVACGVERVNEPGHVCEGCMKKHKEETLVKEEMPVKTDLLFEHNRFARIRKQESGETNE